MEFFSKKQRIGERIAALRKEKGWTQAELAEKLQVSDKAVSKWEKDKGTPSIEFFPILAEFFGVSIDYLMTGQAPEKESITMSKAELCAKNDDVSLLKDIAIQSAIHDGILNIDEIIATNNYELIKKALSAYPIHIVEYLQNLYNAEQYRAIFEWAVDNSNGLADALMSKSDLHIKYVILSDCLKNSSYTNSKHFTLPKYNPTSPNHTIEAWEQVCIAIKNAKQKVLDACAEKFDMTAIFEELSKEYFDLELSKGNTDIVVIKLCVRMEAILRSKGYEGTFEEMLSKYCDTINDSNTASLLHKLRMNRNSIVHSERNAENLSVNEIVACINYICGLA